MLMPIPLESDMRTNKKNITDLNAYNPGKNTEEIILNANENPRNIAKEYMVEIQNMLSSFQFNRYPDTSSDGLRAAYGSYCGADANKIICGNGSDEIIRLAIEGYVDKDECILVHDPTFSMYDITNTICGGRTVCVNANEDFSVKVDDIIAKAVRNRPKLIFMCNPNNPTGNVFSRNEIVKVIKSVNGVVVVDEAYIEFGGESVIDLIEEYDNLLVLRTMSKAFGLCGLRIGFGVGSGEVIDTLNKVKSPYNLNQLSQNIGIIALNHVDRMMEQVQVILGNRDELMAGLKELPYLNVYATNANFIYVKTDVKKVKAALCGKVSLRYFGEKYLRISVGEKDENTRLLELLREVK